MHDRIFTKKTRRGQILKIVREHYLRDDLCCGSESCTNSSCLPAQQQLLSQQKLLLESLPKSISALTDLPHYLVPDTNIILHQVSIKQK